MLAGVSVRHNNQVDSFYLKAYRISWREQQENNLVAYFCAGEVWSGHRG